LKEKFEGENIKILKESQREAEPLLHNQFPLSFEGEVLKGELEGRSPSQKYFPFPLSRGRG